MKTLRKLLFLPFIISTIAFVSVEDIVTAIKNGDATEVSKYFDNTIEITLLEKSNSYSKEQAELVLHDFFASNGVKDFEVLHQSENSGSRFCIGNLQTNNGTFRTTIFMKQKGAKDLIQEIKFEK